MPGRRSKGGPRPPERTSLRPARGRQTAKISEIGDAVTAAKARRSIKLREVEVALRRAGLIALDEQARALGLSRTTTWKILRGNRRSSEPSAATINLTESYFVNQLLLRIKDLPRLTSAED